MGSVMNVKIELPQHYIETEGLLSSDRCAV